MKKTLFTILAAASLLACSKSQVLETVAPEAIAFDNAFVDNATKSNDSFTITAANIKNFNVYGTTQGNEAGSSLVPIFDYVLVEKSDKTWGYADEFTQYWIDGNTYNFAAVVNVAKENVTLDNLVPASIKCDVANQLDILYAGNPYGEYTKGTSVTTVPFTFNHLLAKAFFTFKNEMTSNSASNTYTYRVTDIKINDAAKVATGTVAGVWGAPTEKYNVEFGNITKTFAGTYKGEATLIGAVGAADQSTSLESRLMIPQVNASLNITCKIETLLNGAVIDVENYNTNITKTLEAGKVYNFILAKKNPGDKIEFTVTTVNDWETPIDQKL